MGTKQPKLNVVLKCQDHPRYAAKRRPTSECVVCWQIYVNVLEERLRVINDRRPEK